MASQGYHCGKQAIVEKTNEQLVSVANARAELVESWLDQRSSEIDIIASSPSVARCCAHFADLTEEEIDAEVTMMLRAILNRVAAYDDLTVLGPGGVQIARVSRRILASSEVPSEIRDFAENLLDTSLKPPSEPVLNSDGSVVYRIGRVIGTGSDKSTVIATLNLTRGLDPVVQTKDGGSNGFGLGKTGKVFLAHSKLMPVTEPFAHESRFALRNPLPERYLDLFATRGIPREYMDFLNNTVWGVGAQIEGINWIVVAEQDKAEALAWLYTLIRRVTITGVLSVIVIAFVARWTSQRLGEPLRVLAHVAQQVRGGAMDERVGPLHGAEAEEVRKAFNQMLDDLRDKQKELVRTATLASIGELSSSIVHEMRNPLSSIKMNLQALKRDVEPDPANRELAGIADAQVRRLERMLEDLLQYGRPLELRPEPVSFAEIMGSVSAVVREQALAKRVRIEPHDELLGVKLLVDPEQICRALTNVVMNAMQASPTDGVVAVRARKEALWSDVGFLIVSDAGSGLTDEALERAFSPFFTTKEGGTGLGLANVKKIIELHGGIVTAENGVNGGAVFTMRLPLATGSGE